MPALVDEAARAGPTEVDRVRVQLQAKQLLVGFENYWVLELAAGS